MAFDLAIVEADGNGGDVVLLGNDLAVVFDIENMPYLAMFGGNVKQDTQPVVTEEQSFDWWANNLFYQSEPKVQFNSKTERAFSQVELTSEGRIIIEEAVKTDLKFIADMGYKVEVEVEIPGLDRLTISIRLTKPTGGGQITIINYRKKTDGDFFILDFNNDFFV